MTLNRNMPAGTRVQVTLLTLDRNRARLLVEAPLEFTVDRAEITQRKEAEING